MYLTSLRPNVGVRRSTPAIPASIASQKTFRRAFALPQRAAARSATSRSRLGGRLCARLSRPSAALGQFIPPEGYRFDFSAMSNGDEEFPVQKSKDEWEAVLSSQQFHILRAKGTEMAGTGKYYQHHPSEGVYNCAACDAPLFKALHKFRSQCGWPAFFDAIPDAVGRRHDSSAGMERTEIICNNCGGHLGHLFKGEKTGQPIDQRFCVNSVSLNFDDKSKESKQA